MLRLILSSTDTVDLHQPLRIRITCFKKAHRETGCSTLHFRNPVASLEPVKMSVHQPLCCLCVFVPLCFSCHSASLTETIKASHTIKQSTPCQVRPFIWLHAFFSISKLERMFSKHPRVWLIWHNGIPQNSQV